MAFIYLIILSYHYYHLICLWVLYPSVFVFLCVVFVPIVLLPPLGMWDSTAHPILNLVAKFSLIKFPPSRGVQCDV
jgi:hypothetical protein